MLLFLREALGAEVEALLNPARDLTDMPLKTFYRYALPRLGAGGVRGGAGLGGLLKGWMDG